MNVTHVRAASLSQYAALAVGLATLASVAISAPAIPATLATTDTAGAAILAEFNRSRETRPFGSEFQDAPHAAPPDEISALFDSSLPLSVTAMLELNIPTSATRLAVDALDKGMFVYLAIEHTKRMRQIWSFDVVDPFGAHSDLLDHLLRWPLGIADYEQRILRGLQAAGASADDATIALGLAGERARNTKDEVLFRQIYAVSSEAIALTDDPNEAAFLGVLFAVQRSSDLPSPAAMPVRWEQCGHAIYLIQNFYLERRNHETGTDEYIAEYYFAGFDAHDGSLRWTGALRHGAPVSDTDDQTLVRHYLSQLVEGDPSSTDRPDGD